MKLKIALVEMEGTQFGLAVVSEGILDDPVKKADTHRFFEQRVFRDLPVVLVGEDFLTAPRFYGPEELSEFMKGVQMEMIEWADLDLPFNLPS